MGLAALLSELGGRLGVANLRVDSSGICALTFDGRLDVELREVAGAIVVTGHLGELPERGRAARLATMLEGNLLGHGVGAARLAFDGDLGEAFLVQDVAGTIAYPEFEQTLEAFVGRLDFWSRKLGREGSDTALSAADVTARPGSFIRV